MHSSEEPTEEAPHAGSRERLPLPVLPRWAAALGAEALVFPVLLVKMFYLSGQTQGVEPRSANPTDGHKARALS